MNLREAAEMALEALETLWDILDDIDTASDMAKENDAWYRKRVEALQKKRWDTMITTDGYKLKGGPVEALRQAIAEAEKTVPSDYSNSHQPVAQCTYPQCQATNGCVGACSKGQEEKQEPSLWFAIGKDGRVKYTTDSDRALKWKQAGLYRLVRDYYTSPVHASDISAERVDETAKDRHELAGTIPISNGGVATRTPSSFISPPKREWVGLTFTEYMEAIKGKEDIEDCWQAIEAKLKEKNG